MKLSHGGPSQRKASNTNHQIENLYYVMAFIESEAWGVQLISDKVFLVVQLKKTTKL